MLLMVKAWGSNAWYDKILPLLNNAGFQERDDLQASDPNSDGELMYIYFDLNRDDMPVDEFQQVIDQARALINTDQTPALEMSLVDRK